MPVPTTLNDSNAPQPQRLESFLEFGSLHYPSRNALTYYTNGERRVVTYSDLWARVRQIACALRLHVHQGRDTPFVPLFLQNGPNQVVATLATLLSGAAFVPVALDATPSRFRAIVERTQSTVLVTDSTHKAGLASLLSDSGLEHLAVLDLDDIKNEVTDDQLDSSGLSTTDAAYVLFSSGTTGMSELDGTLWIHTDYCLRCTKGHRYLSCRRTELLQGEQRGVQGPFRRQMAASRIVYV